MLEYVMFQILQILVKANTVLSSTPVKGNLHSYPKGHGGSEHLVKNQSTTEECSHSPMFHFCSKCKGYIIKYTIYLVSLSVTLS